jgi:nicotinamide-nucleotide adenylyltransferase
MASSSPAAPAAPILAFFERGLAEFRASGADLRVLATATAPPDDDGGGGVGQAAPALPLPLPSPWTYDDNGDDDAAGGPLVVLDSSFNPPTAAHMGMLLHSVRRATAAAAAAAGTKARPRALLLLALANADKPEAPAPFAQRLGMMHAFAHDALAVLAGEKEKTKDICADETAAAAAAAIEVDVDIGVTTRPYFTHKSALLAGAYRGGREQVFVLGFDTLARLLEPRYYFGEGGSALALAMLFERARVDVFVRTTAAAEDGREEGEGEGDQRARIRGFLDGRPWRERVWVETADEEAARKSEFGVRGGVSSSRVREGIKEGREEGMWRGMLGERVRAWVLEMGLYR